MKTTRTFAPSFRTFGFLLGATALVNVACGGDLEPGSDTSDPSILQQEVPSTDRPDPIVRDGVGTDTTGADEVEPCDDSDADALLACQALALVGDWRGRAVRDDGPGYTVEVRFYDDGTYALRCPLFGASGPGLCLEEDGKETRRAFELTRVADDGSTSGRIEVPRQASWSYIADLMLSADHAQLRFEVWSPWDGNEVLPTVVTLTRVP